MTTASMRALGFADASTQFLGRLLGNVDRLVGEVRRDSRAVASEAEALYAAVQDKQRKLSTAWSSAPRWRAIAATILPLVARYRLLHARAENWSAERKHSAYHALHEEGAERVFEMCTQLRGGILKVGQLLSSRPDLLPAPYIERLQLLQDQVPAIDGELIAERFEEEIGPIADHFAEFDLEAIAAASLAQVHRARTLLGQAVAVKVVRPGAEEEIAVDQAALSMLADVLVDSTSGSLATFASEIAGALANEVDLAREAESARAIARNLAADPVVVPAVHDELSSRRVLTMDLVVGCSIREFLKSPRDEDAVERVFDALGDSLMAQVFRDGLCHADPHPGNLMVTDDGALAYVDFGCVLHLSSEERHAYASVIQAFVAGDRQRLAAALRELGFDTIDGEETALMEMADLTLGAFSPDSDWQEIAARMPQSFAEMAAMARTGQRVLVPASFVLLGRVLATVGGLYLNEKPKSSLFPALLRHLPAAT